MRQHRGRGVAAPMQVLGGPVGAAHVAAARWGAAGLGLVVHPRGWGAQGGFLPPGCGGAPCPPVLHQGGPHAPVLPVPRAGQGAPPLLLAPPGHCVHRGAEERQGHVAPLCASSGFTPMHKLCPHALCAPARLPASGSQSPAPALPRLFAAGREPGQVSERAGTAGPEITKYRHALLPPAHLAGSTCSLPVTPCLVVTHPGCGWYDCLPVPWGGGAGGRQSRAPQALPPPTLQPLRETMSPSLGGLCRHCRREPRWSPMNLHLTLPPGRALGRWRAGTVGVGTRLACSRPERQSPAGSPPVAQGAFPWGRGRGKTLQHPRPAGYVARSRSPTAECPCPPREPGNTGRNPPRGQQGILPGWTRSPCLDMGAGAEGGSRASPAGGARGWGYPGLAQHNLALSLASPSVGWTSPGISHPRRDPALLRHWLGWDLLPSLGIGRSPVRGRVTWNPGACAGRAPP